MRISNLLNNMMISRGQGLKETLKSNTLFQLYLKENVLDQSFKSYFDLFSRISTKKPLEKSRGFFMRRRTLNTR